MYRKSRRKRRPFYPEFYSDDEIKGGIEAEIEAEINGAWAGIVPQEPESDAQPIELAEREDTALQVKADYNGMLYPDNLTVSERLEDMQRDYISKKLEVSRANINRNEAAIISEHNELSIEIPDDIYSEELDMQESIPVFEHAAQPGPEAEPVEEDPPRFEAFAGQAPEPEPELEPEPQAAGPEYADHHSKAQSGLTPLDVQKAIEYAHRWALDRNPSFLDFEELGGDCTNYISQILLAGGCPMDHTPVLGWHYNDGSDKSPSWTGVEQFYDYLMRDKERGIFGTEISAEEARPGDIVQLSFNGRNFQHAGFIVGLTREESAPFGYDTIKINAHSFDSQNRALDTYQWRIIRFIRVLGHK